MRNIDHIKNFCIHKSEDRFIFYNIGPMSKTFLLPRFFLVRKFHLSKNFNIESHLNSYNIHFISF